MLNSVEVKCGHIWPLSKVRDKKFHGRIWPLSGVMDFNALINRGHIDVDGKHMGGDYKFLLLVCGLSGATSNYAAKFTKINDGTPLRIKLTINNLPWPDLFMS